jgi:hypothetical protein
MMTLAQKRAARLRGILAVSAPGMATATPAPEGGPGTELRRLLHTLGIQPKGKDCQCNAHALEMDRNGVEWCQANVESIIDWLVVEAKKRPLVGMLFSRLAARQMVALAISRARKKRTH